MRLLRIALPAALVCAPLLIPAPPLAAADDPAVLAADHDFMQAAAKSDKTALGKLLDTDFLWIDASGRMQNRAQIETAVPKLAISNESMQEIRHDYGEVETVLANSGRMHVLRVWVKRPAGWRALVYQEVESLDAPPKITPSAKKDCQNPCKTVGYTPKTDVEREVITSYQGLETSAMTKNADGFDSHTGEEFLAASSNSDKLIDKQTRLAELRTSNMAGLAPTALTSANMFVFGDAAVMRSHHVPQGPGKPLQVTRVFVKRAGKWVEVLSYQTSIHG